MASLSVSSSAFSPGDVIPPRYTCLGDNVSPPLEWSDPPAGTRTIAILCDDPDSPSGDWVHWVLFNLPPDARQLPENLSPTAHLPNGAVQGVNDFHEHGYGGPCPPPGKPHRYNFTVFALDTELRLSSKATKKELVRAAHGHILAQGKLTGMFRH
jgi:Raf kinase inhibitor-like YbhB/YbcL family protein